MWVWRVGRQLIAGSANECHSFSQTQAAQRASAIR